jgi:hypothetical protein
MYFKAIDVPEKFEKDFLVIFLCLGLNPSRMTSASASGKGDFSVQRIGLLQGLLEAHDPDFDFKLF